MKDIYLSRYVGLFESRASHFSYNFLCNHMIFALKFESRKLDLLQFR